jgi:hypothetical protein
LAKVHRKTILRRNRHHFDVPKILFKLSEESVIDPWWKIKVLLAGSLQKNIEDTMPLISLIHYNFPLSLITNSNTVLASDLAKTMCDNILKDEEEELPVPTVTESKDNTALAGATANGTLSPDPTTPTVPSANPTTTNSKTKNKKAKKLAKNSTSSDGGSGVDADTNGKEDNAADTAPTVKG